MSNNLADPISNGASGKWLINLSTTKELKGIITIQSQTSDRPNADITAVDIKIHISTPVSKVFTCKDGSTGKISTTEWVKNNTDPNKTISFTKSGDPIKMDGSNLFTATLELNLPADILVQLLTGAMSYIEVTLRSNDNKEWYFKVSFNDYLTNPTPATTQNCTTHNGSIQHLIGVTCDEAKKVVAASPPGQNQNYQPFTVPELGVWGTQDQYTPNDSDSQSKIRRFLEDVQDHIKSRLDTKKMIEQYFPQMANSITPDYVQQGMPVRPDIKNSSGQQPYSSQDGTKSFMWYPCERYPDDCK